ncbi:uncharacterized protein LOC107647148 [Arachis ipaensis]|uniref:uncharacterized protein LOC107647148 n=1 Tax=Arachis ipaensis TaxID=130454 RepID=UPI0007AFD27D|nr:uncharacterized protein LOC107647148 [Arachis ipaensis]
MSQKREGGIKKGGRAERPPHTPERHVHMIDRRFAGGKISKSSRKRHFKEVYHVGEGDRSPDLPTIAFTKEDAASIIPGHDDPMVVTIILANANLHRTLVDQGSSTDILFKSTFKKLGLQEKELRAYPNSLFGLGDALIQPLGYIPLRTTFGKGTRSRTLSIDYTVVDVNSAYNAFIGRTTLNQLAAVVSTPHLCMKFPTPEGIATIKGDQKLTRRCYNESLNFKGDPRGKEANTIELGGTRAREEFRPQLEGETEEVQIGDSRGKTTNVGANLREYLKELLIKFLRKNSDLFAWKAADMPGINPGLMCHKLAVYPGSRSVQQKRRKLVRERSQVMEEQIQALLEAGFIREVKYPLWLANVVLVKKPDGKWRMCVDYTDFNKACLKYPYPLPNIDTLVDVLSGYKYLSFMDDYSRYNQIPMHQPDQEKTSFLTPKANYCYVVMPFELKNAGTTYQRLMNKVFADHIGKLMEVYVDDMLVKTQSEEMLLPNPAEVFSTIRKHGMRLNPTKCTFAVEAGKFLGFMLTDKREFVVDSEFLKVRISSLQV